MLVVLDGEGGIVKQMKRVAEVSIPEKGGKGKGSARSIYTTEKRKKELQREAYRHPQKKKISK